MQKRIANNTMTHTQRRMRYWQTCITETNEIADPRSEGGLVNLDFGLAEKAVGDADRTFNTWIEIR